MSQYSFENKIHIDPEMIYRIVRDGWVQSQIQEIKNGPGIKWVFDNPGMSPQLAYESLLSLRRLLVKMASDITTDSGILNQMTGLTSEQLRETYQSAIDQGLQDVEAEIEYLEKHQHPDTSHRYFDEMEIGKPYPNITPKPKVKSQSGQKMVDKGRENKADREKVLSEARQIMSQSKKPRSYFVTASGKASSNLYSPVHIKNKDISLRNIRYWLDNAIRDKEI